MSVPAPLRQWHAGHLAVAVHADRTALGAAAAQAVAHYLGAVQRAGNEARVIFACASSQDEFLQALTSAPLAAMIDWPRLTAFHMDDYVGLAGDHPQSFRRYLRTHLLDRAPVGRFHPLRAEASDLAAECARYAALLSERPIDLICLGIGENGHLAFNDPPVADFDDDALVKVVELDDACRRQQVNDGCFPAFEAVPARALTLTLPVFRTARRLSVQVPGPRKAPAVRATLQDPVTTACPATLLRTHTNATLFLDSDSAALV